MVVIIDIGLPATYICPKCGGVVKSGEYCNCNCKEKYVRAGM